MTGPGSLTVQGVALPAFLYGTAWKEERTSDLVVAALTAGFRGLDTANQRKHYFEAAVGDGIARAEAAGICRRADLFLQTKFTFAPGQDHRLPYDPHASYTEQVRQSLASSLEHLRTSRLDSYLLHGPSVRDGLAAADHEVWRAMEEAQRAGLTRLIGVSNVSLPQLKALWGFAAVKPAFVQNRTFARTGWDAGVRDFCSAHGIVYQGFSLLTANAAELRDPRVEGLCARHGLTAAQLVFRFAIESGMLPLTGTTRPDHMAQDLACRPPHPAGGLSPDERQLIETLAL